MKVREWEQWAMAPQAVLRAARKVSRLLADQDIHHALGGGLAVGLYGHNRMTTTIDFVVSRTASTTICWIAPSVRTTTGVSIDVDDVRVDFHFVAKPIRWGDISSTERLVGLPVLRIAALVALTVVAGGSAQLLDVIELMKLGNVSVDAVSSRLTSKALDRFRRLTEIARLEKAGEMRAARQILIAMLTEAARA